MTNCNCINLCILYTNLQCIHCIHCIGFVHVLFIHFTLAVVDFLKGVLLRFDFFSCWYLSKKRIIVEFVFCIGISGSFTMIGINRECGFGGAKSFLLWFLRPFSASVRKVFSKNVKNCLIFSREIRLLRVVLSKRFPIISECWVRVSLVRSMLVVILEGGRFC